MPDIDSIRRQLRHRLEDLRQAGIDFLPRAESPPAGLVVHESATVDALPSETTALSGVSDQRRIELQILAVKVSQCTRCPELVSTRSQTVFGAGPLDAELCFVGEAPGADEDREGIPFVGAAGQLLNRIIIAMGMKREEVYICNTLRCRPPGNRTPKPDECENCREYLEGQLELVRPKFICALGGSASQALLGLNSTMAKLRGRFYIYKDIPVICTYHPSYLLPHRSPERKKEVWDDMKMLLARMGRPVPAAGGTNRSATTTPPAQRS